MMSDELHVVVGLGATGLSCLRFLSNQNYSIAVMDTRPNPPQALEVLTQFPEVATYFGDLDKTILKRAERIIVSPGVPIKTPAIAEQIAQGKNVIGDIELFAKVVQAP